MRFLAVILLAMGASVSLSACAVIGVATDVAGAVGTVVSTTASVTGDVVGAAARTITGGDDHASDKDSH